MVATSRPRSTPRPSRLVALLAAQAVGEGFSPSRLPGVKFMRSTLHVPSSAIAYEPCIVVVAQGRKVGRLGTRTFVYDPDNYLVLAVPLPFECETHGTPEEPMYGLSIGVTPALVTELLMHMESTPSHAPADPRAVQSAALSDDLRDAAVRLAEALQTTDGARILGPQIVREIIYRTLCGPLGGNLRALAATHSHFGQISRVLQRLHVEYARSHQVETLARDAGMSLSTFHTHFKAVTDSSPLQYLKTIRLHKARLLMVQDGVGAAHAAVQVGYESASQFSREFKRLFGEAPAAEAARLRTSLVGLA